VDAIAGKMGSDIVLLDISKITLVADYFVIATADTQRQLGAVAEDIRQATKEVGVSPRPMEGNLESGWVLLDYGSVIVHLFLPAQREYYALEELWREAKTVVRMA
jgi:ribosome-associated protein